MRKSANGLAVLIAFGSVNCASAQAPSTPQQTTQTCSVVSALRPIPVDIRETSGLARGRANPDVFWTHNDSGGHPELFALASDGSLRARVRVNGASFVDWEDVEAAPCGDRSCLYIADIGDNAGSRNTITVYEVPEPSLEATSTEVTRVTQLRFPDGPQDAEALFRLPSGEMFIVTKGRQKSIKLYRVGQIDASGHGTLELVREIAPRPRGGYDWVTAASASPSGKWIAIRSYTTLFIYRADDLLGTGQPLVTYSLRALAEKQGESVALDDDGTVWVTSEAERLQDRPMIGQLRCTLN